MAGSNTIKKFKIFYRNSLGWTYPKEAISKMWVAVLTDCTTNGSTTFQKSSTQHPQVVISFLKHNYVNEQTSQGCRNLIKLMKTIGHFSKCETKAIYPHLSTQLCNEASKIWRIAHRLTISFTPHCKLCLLSFKRLPMKLVLSNLSHTIINKDLDVTLIHQFKLFRNFRLMHTSSILEIRLKHLKALKTKISQEM